jgi:WS/DGAT/MGAT family acyltransferase
MHTLGTMIVDPSTLSGGRFDYAHLRETILQHIHLTPPWRQRLVEVPFGLDHPMLIDDPDFCIDDHLHRAALPSPGTMRELADFVADVASRPLDRARPLWETWLVEGLPDGHLALVTKLHHCLSDGASGSSQMSSLLEREPDAAPPAPGPVWDPDPLPSPLAMLREALHLPLANPVAVGRALRDTGRGLYQRAVEQRELAREGAPVPALVESAPRTRFTGSLTPRRTVAFASAPLDDVKFIKNTFGVKVNDVVLAACAISLRRYLEAHDDLPEAPLVCGVPVSVKSAAEKEEFSNKVSAMLVRLPTQVGDPEQVIANVHAETRTAKRLFEAIEGDLMGEWSALVPASLMRLGTQVFFNDTATTEIYTPLNCIVSNMPGPPMLLYWGGARVLATYPMGPLSAGVGLNITVLSNMGRLDLGVLACRDTVPDVADFADGFAQAVAELEVAARKLEAARSGEGGES